MAHGDYDYGLEDKLLRKNIPGRYSTWEDDDHEPSEPEHPDQQGSAAVAVTPQDAGRQTGPKGVLKVVPQYFASLSTVRHFW